MGGLGSVCIPSHGVGERGQLALRGIRLDASGGSLRAERGLWGVWVCVLSLDYTIESGRP